MEPPIPRYLIDEQIRHRLTSERYISKYSVTFYLHDVINLLLSSRTHTPLELIARYFSDVSLGLHVIDRDFRYILATPRNRISFISLFTNLFSAIPRTKSISSEELFSLIGLLCPTFPRGYSNRLYQLTFFQVERRPKAGELWDALYLYFLFAEFFETVLRDCFSTQRRKSIRARVLLKKLETLCSVNLRLHQRWSAGSRSSSSQDADADADADGVGDDRDDVDEEEEEEEEAGESRKMSSSSLPLDLKSRQAQVPLFPAAEFLRGILLSKVEENDSLSFGEFCMMIFRKMMRGQDQEQGQGQGQDEGGIWSGLVTSMDMRVCPFSVSVIQKLVREQGKYIDKIVTARDDDIQYALATLRDRF